mgnify:FL=1
MFSSKTDLWSTPQNLFDELNKEFSFDLDPCATPENAKCPIYFTKEEDGLSKDWSTYSVFCNPPYGRDIYNWVRKCYESSFICPSVVALLPARTDTRWFHEFIYHHAEVRFIKGRLKFGNSRNTAPFPSMIVIWRN